MNTIALPIKIRVASPCHARWEEMSGDHQTRFCNLCQKNVFDLSTLTATEAAALIKAKEGKLCVRFYQRPDGTLLTADCPVGLARAWKRTRNLLITVAALILFVILNVAALTRKQNPARPPNRFVQDMESAKYKIKEKLGLNPPRLMGAMAAPLAIPQQPVKPQQKKS